MYNLKLLPLKLRVYQYLAETEKPLTEEEIFDALEPEYGTESQFTKKRIGTYLVSMMATGQVEETGVDYNDKGELQVHFKLSELGKYRATYLPKNHNEAAYE